MSKYLPLSYHLKKLASSSLNVWHASFDEIENILDSKLPDSAYKYPAWWSNEQGNKNHVQCHAWLEAGWKTEDLNLVAEEIIFKKDSI